MQNDTCHACEMLLQLPAMPTDRPPIPWAALLAMILILVASTMMFVLLVRRWTSHRQWVSLADWARERRFKLRPALRAFVPQPLDALVRTDDQVRFHLCDPRTTLLLFETDAPAPAPDPTAQSPQGKLLWNVLIRRRDAEGAAAGLRPVSQTTSLLDLMELSRFPAMTASDRFTVHARDSATARRLADTSARALLPPDIGLLLLPQHVLLDFSARPFDPIEFDRMLSLADQLAAFLG
jgi:hypothetical protein